MPRWVKLCSMREAPQPGDVREVRAEGIGICLANVEGHLYAVQNTCPHAGGSLGQGWLKGSAIVCPLHSWTFDLVTGIAQEPEKARVAIFPLRLEKDEILTDVG